MDFPNNGLGTLPFISSVSTDFKMHETESASPFQCISLECFRKCACTFSTGINYP